MRGHRELLEVDTLEVRVVADGNVLAGGRLDGLLAGQHEILLLSDQVVVGGLSRMSLVEVLHLVHALQPVVVERQQPFILHTGIDELHQLHVSCHRLNQTDVCGTNFRCQLLETDHLDVEKVLRYHGRHPVERKLSVKRWLNHHFSLCFFSHPEGARG